MSLNTPLLDKQQKKRSSSKSTKKSKTKEISPLMYQSGDPFELNSNDQRRPQSRGYTQVVQQIGQVGDVEDLSDQYSQKGEDQPRRKIKKVQSSEKELLRRVSVKSNNIDCEATNACACLQEPEFCSTSSVSTLQSELDSLRADDIQSKPLEIYLRNCRRFAKQKLEHKILTTQDYQFSRKDFESGLVDKKILSKIGVNINLLLPEDIEISQCFYTEQIKLFSDIIFIDGKQILVVKTWQQVLVQQSHGVPSESMTSFKQSFKKKYRVRSRKLNRSIISGASLEVNDRKIPQSDQEDFSFMIKTMQFFDRNGNSINSESPILVEQIYGKFDSYRLYDVSLIQYGNKVYYFKRLFQTEISSLVESKDTSYTKSVLQLFSYDLTNGKEEQVENFCFNEKDPEVGDPEKELETLQSGGIPLQFNLQFSSRFGQNQQEYTSEEHFLKSQYILAQEYIHSKEFHKFFIYESSNLSLNRESQLIQTEAVNMFSSNSDINRQVQLVNHISGYKDENETIYFIIQNMFIVTQIKFSMETRQMLSLDPCQRNTQDIFQKIWNTNGLSIQKADLLLFNEKDTKEKIEQYYFVDSRNRIQILFPNYNQKVERVKIIEQISEQTGIKQLKFKEHKKINYISQNKNVHKNIFQRISDIRNILNFDNIYQAHQLIFCEDNNSQVLYISEPKSRSIILMQMQQHNCEICQQTYSIEQEKMISEQSQAILQSKHQVSVNALMKQVTCSINQKMGGIKQRNKQLNYGNQDLSSSFCQVCDEDHKQEYVAYNIPQPQLSKYKHLNFRREETNSDGSFLYRLDNEERINHVLIDDFNGRKIKVKTHETDSRKRKVQQLRLLLYQPSSSYSCFVFAVFNQEDQRIEGPNMTSDKPSKKSYFFIIKQNDEMNRIFKSLGNYPIVTPSEYVYLLKSYKKIERVKFKQIKEFQFKQVDTLSNDSARDKNARQVQQDIDQFIDCKISFVKISDQKKNINFIPFIYQAKNNQNINKLISFDIFSCKLSTPISINPPKQQLKFLYEDDQGYFCFYLCRTSDIWEEDPDRSSKVPSYYDKNFCKQRAKFQIFTLYGEKVGILKCQEYLFTSDTNGVHNQQIGQKIVLFSKKVREIYDWQQIKNIGAIPFYDYKCRSIKGCQLVLQTTEEEYTHINLFDQDNNNIYTYASQIVMLGQKKFQIDPNDPDMFVMVISSLLRKDIIERDLFDRYECYQILSRAIEFIFRMRIPDLKYLILNSFDSLQKNDFFLSQEILHGKSICEISLSDPEAVLEGIDQYNLNQKEQKLSRGSVVEQMTKDDYVRRETFQEIGLYPKCLLIQQDWNFVCTIERALMQNSFKSAKILIDHIFQVINTFDYQPMIMNDLPCLLSCKQIQVNEFFELSESERKSRDLSGFCNMEIPIKNVEIPLFSDQKCEYLRINQLEQFHEYKDEISEKIIHRDRCKLPDIEKTFEVEHLFVDYRDLIIGEKIRKIDELKSKDDIKFDDMYYASWMLKCGDTNLSFYLQESVQKIIDFQWVNTKILMKYLFFIFLFLYILPICSVLFTKEERIHDISYKIALLPSYFFFGIEMVQIKQQGISYFAGWNLIDFSQFLVFQLLLYLKYRGAEDDNIYIPELKMLLIVLAFFKLLFFVRIFEQYGFLIQMIYLCLVDLIPFITSYCVFLLVFSICYVVLQMEIDPEVDEAEGLSYFEKTLLQTFRTSIGELGMPTYTAIQNQEDSMFKTLNIFLIWATWFIQTFFMFVVMLNFLIAVIQSTYDRVMNYQKIISYRHKAELNEECQTLLGVFYNLQEYRIIVFSTSKQNLQIEEDNLGDIVETMKKLVLKENKQLISGHEELKINISSLDEGHDALNQRIKKNFDTLFEKQEQLREDLIRELQMKA